MPLSESKECFEIALAEYVEDDEPDEQSEEDRGSEHSMPASDPPSTTDPGSGADKPDTMDGATLDEAVEESFPASDPYQNGLFADTPPHHHEQHRGERAVAIEEDAAVHVKVGDEEFDLNHGHVVIAAITSCTNTSNPSVMLGAGILARNAVERGLQSKPWVKTSLAPGSKVVTEYYERAGLVEPLEALGFHLVGYGCTTCIGNSGRSRRRSPRRSTRPTSPSSRSCPGNRNFEGRINADVKMNYLASPPLVVAYALAGTMDIDLYDEPLGEDKDGEPVYLKDIWPTGLRGGRPHDRGRRALGHVPQELRRGLRGRRALELARRSDGRPLRLGRGLDLRAPAALLRRHARGARARHRREGRAGPRQARRQHHHRPHLAGRLDPQGQPAGRYLIEHGVEPRDFNSYGSRRGSHEVMVRGTFANVRLRNQLAPGTEGGVTRFLANDGDTPSGAQEEMPIFDAAMKYLEQEIPLVVLAGKEYGSGSSRDWAAKGTSLLGVRAVIAESFERIHRSNLVGMGVLPLQFADGESAESLGLTGEEVFDITGFEGAEDVPRELTVKADGKEFTVTLRIDTPKEAEYFRHGGILQYVLRQLLSAA